MESTTSIIAKMQADMSKAKSKKYTRIANHFIQSDSYSIYEKLVYLNLKVHCFTTDLSWPSIKKLVARVPCCRNTAMSALKGLIKKGAIEKIDGKHRSTTYRLKIGPFYQPNKLIR